MHLNYKHVLNQIHLVQTKIKKNTKEERKVKLLWIRCRRFTPKSLPNDFDPLPWTSQTFLRNSLEFAFSLSCWKVSFPSPKIPCLLAFLRGIQKEDVLKFSGNVARPCKLTQVAVQQTFNAWILLFYQEVMARLCKFAQAGRVIHYLKTPFLSPPNSLLHD